MKAPQTQLLLSSKSITGSRAKGDESQVKYFSQQWADGSLSDGEVEAVLSQYNQDLRALRRLDAFGPSQRR